ncbi:MAG: cobalamin 5'-phosphate synthase CobS [Phormidesmis priestleyi Ana]|uniref:Adenosylcobinamide-GDP ribazoletransferase n=1 Tax=Phormidesmis priestleyi Ana TaxID=1666911 RepID=A0A0P7YXD0_9CYAN|nr:MAG: cobalamin 5'-phosphate synthase CobS [Phormidesmis priestleyi Ana]
MFYTCLPIPPRWPLEFRWIACWVPGVGIVVGGLLALAYEALSALRVPNGVSSVLVVALWIAVTGGLHLDGVMDTADGLAVPDANRRLAVMSDSRMGAFGGMALVVLILLKVMALAALPDDDRAFALVSVAVWGRWGQQWAIARYSYLKKEGKGAFHQAALPSVQYTLPSLAVIILISGSLGWFNIVSAAMVWRTMIGGFVIATLTSAYFNKKLGGHTGDTYGAVVEWTEALLLCSLTAL